jgi:hypothetical protein
MSTENIHIVHTAAELWHLAGPDMGLYSWDSSDGCALLRGELTYCVKMTREEYDEYQALSLRYAQPWLGDELEGAPSVSMLAATADEEAEVGALRLRPNSSFVRSFREIDECLVAYTRCLSDDERDEIIRQIVAKLRTLKEAVLRCEEIWAEMGADEEARHREDIEKLAHIRENEWLQAENEGRLTPTTTEGGAA